MQDCEFKLRFLGQDWTEGFEFQEDPSIELVINTDNLKSIYEKPFFNLTVFNDLRQAIEDYKKNISLCGLLDIEIYKGNNQLIWSGLIDIGNAKHFFSTTDKGCYIELEITDRNITYFETYGAAEFSLISPFDAECNTIDPPDLVDATLFDPATPGSSFDRKLYLVDDLFRHLVDLVSRENVVYESDFFSTGECAGLLLGNGSQIRIDPNLACQQITELSFDSLFNELGKYFNLFKRHYTDSLGVNRVKIEPFPDFFTSNDKFEILDVANVQQSTKFNKLYSVAVLGDSSDIDTSSFTPSFAPFDFTRFSEQIPDVSSECSTGVELQLQSDFLSNTNKIEWALNDVSGEYDDDIFLIQAIGNVATPTFQPDGTAYYNSKMSNSEVLLRYFPVVGPQSMAPGEFGDLNFFFAENCDPIGVPGNTVSSGAIPGLPTALGIGDFRAKFSLISYDNDAILTEPTYTASTNLFVLPGTPYTEATITKGGDYSFSTTLFIGLSGGTITASTFLIKAAIDHRTAAQVLITRYETAFSVITIGSTIKINFQTPEFSVLAGEKITVRILSNTVSVATGSLTWDVLANSTFSFAGCSNLQTTFDPDSLLNLIYFTEFSDYPIKDADIQTLRDNPFLTVRVISGEIFIDSFIERFKMNLINGSTQVSLQGAKIFADRF